MQSCGTSGSAPTPTARGAAVRRDIPAVELRARSKQQSAGEGRGEIRVGEVEVEEASTSWISIRAGEMPLSSDGGRCGRKHGLERRRGAHSSHSERRGGGKAKRKPVYLTNFLIRAEDVGASKPDRRAQRGVEDGDRGVGVPEQRAQHPRRGLCRR